MQPVVRAPLTALVMQDSWVLKEPTVTTKRKGILFSTKDALALENMVAGTGLEPVTFGL